MTAALPSPPGTPDLPRRILDLLDALLRASPTGADAALSSTLALLAALFGVDRAAVVRPGSDPSGPDLPACWSSDGVAPAGIGLSPADHARLEARGILEVAALSGLGWRLLFALPAAGMLVLDGARGGRRLTPDEILAIRPLAAAMGGLLARQAQEREIALVRQELQDERTRLEATRRVMPDLMIELDHEGRFVAWHAGQETGGAVSAGDFLGRRLEERLSADLAALARGIMAEVDAHGASTGHEYRIPLPHGLRSHRVSAARLAPPGTQRRPAYLIAVRDTTEAQAQRRLLERLGLFARLTTNLVIATDDGLRIDWMNPAAETATGHALEEVRGRTLCEVLRGEASGPCPAERLVALLDAGGPQRTELLARARDGRAYWLELSIHPLVERMAAGPA